VTIASAAAVQASERKPVRDDGSIPDSSRLQLVLEPQLSRRLRAVLLASQEIAAEQLAEFRDRAAHPLAPPLGLVQPPPLRLDPFRVRDLRVVRLHTARASARAPSAAAAAAAKTQRARGAAGGWNDEGSLSGGVRARTT